MVKKMLSKSFEDIAVEISTMEKDQIIHKITHFRGTFKMDFTEEFLNKLSIDRLRHILMAAVVTGKSHQTC